MPTSVKLLGRRPAMFVKLLFRLLPIHACTTVVGFFAGRILNSIS